MLVILNRGGFTATDRCSGGVQVPSRKGRSEAQFPRDLHVYRSFEATSKASSMARAATGLVVFTCFLLALTCVVRTQADRLPDSVLALLSAPHSQQEMSRKLLADVAASCTDFGCALTQKLITMTDKGL